MSEATPSSPALPQQLSEKVNATREEVRGHIKSLPSRRESNFTNCTTSHAKGGRGGSGDYLPGRVWGSYSRNLKTYIATDVERTKLPEDQVIKTEKLNILLKHFYSLGEQDAAHASHHQHWDRAKGKKKRRLNIFSSTSASASAAAVAAKRQQHSHGRSNSTTTN